MSRLHCIGPGTQSISLCNLCVLRASVVKHRIANHGGMEDTEVAQREQLAMITS